MDRWNVWPVVRHGNAAAPGDVAVG